MNGKLFEHKIVKWAEVKQLEKEGYEVVATMNMPERFVMKKELSEWETKK